MKRYQVYLNPNSVSVLDDFERYAHIPRSKLIREVIDRLAHNLIRVFVAKNVSPKDVLILDSLIGSIHRESKKATNYALQDDRRYLVD